MVKQGKHSTFTQDWLDLIFVDQLVFAENFDRVKSARVFFTSQNNAAESATAHDTHLLEVFDRNVALLDKARTRLAIQLCIGIYKLLKK